MTKFQEQRSYKKTSPDDGFIAAEKAFVKAGYQIVKKREIAWLIMAKRTTGDSVSISANFTAQPGAQTTAILTLNSDQMTDVELKAEVGRFFDTLDPLLG